MTLTEVHHVMCVVGARPNFMKIAPIMRAFGAREGLRASLVHTGQHYDDAMKAAFFQQLDIPVPEVDLGVGSGSHADQTAEIMRRFDPVLDHSGPDAVLVVGDVNSTIACALVAAKRGIPVIHVEAGLRSFDRRMPEEINRVLTDQISDLLFTTERGAAENLAREGIPGERVCFVGNVMIDTLMHSRERCPEVQEVLGRFADAVDVGRDGCFGVVTLHRPSNVDDLAVFDRLARVLGELAEEVPLVFPVHPRTRARLDSTGLARRFGPGVIMLPPLGYLEMLSLLMSARVVLTDSGGIQEETTALGVPCITLRESTERPVTVTQGTNVIVGTDPERIRASFADVAETGGKRGRIPEFWDGHAAERIAEEVLRWASRHH
jgi:UDP-N-acetylglucosamine 2-epimerase (non-hydrolysing)